MSVEEKYGEAVRAGAHIWPGTVCRPAGPDGGAWAGDGTGGRTRAGAGSGTGFLRTALIAVAAAEVLAVAGGVEGEDILSALARVEYAERAGVPEEGSGGFSGRLGIRFELKDGTLWFYRETIDTH